MLTKFVVVVTSHYMSVKVIRVYTLNLYSVVYQLYLNKTGENKSKSHSNQKEHYVFEWKFQDSPMFQYM